MPFINTKVNFALKEQEKERLKTELGHAIGIIPGKEEKWLMLDFTDNCNLYFRGKNDIKIAFLEVKSFGPAEPQVYESMTAKICDIFAEVIGVPKDQLYITYEEIQQWGWNGTQF